MRFFSAMLVEKNSLKEIESPFSRASLTISHLLFADDVLIFAKANGSAAASINSLLKEFKDLTRLNVNADKSQVFFSAAELTTKTEICSTLRFIEKSLPIRYFGLPLFSARLSLSDCIPIVEKVQNILAGWKSKL